MCEAQTNRNLLCQVSCGILQIEELMGKLLPIVQEKQGAKGKLKMLSCPILKRWGLYSSPSQLHLCFSHPDVNTQVILNSGPFVLLTLTNTQQACFENWPHIVFSRPREYAMHWIEKHHLYERVRKSLRTGALQMNSLIVTLSQGI